LSTFLLNHPISHVFVINVVLGVVALSLNFVADTLIEVFGVPAGAWAPGTAARPWWIAAGLFSVLLYPLSIIVSIGWAGHNGLLLCLPSLPFAALWWLHTRRRLQARATEIGLPWRIRQSSKRQWFFGTADTKTLKVMRFAIGVLAVIGFSGLMQGFTSWTVGDPSSIDGLGPNGATIHPRPYIVAACPASVHEVLHLIGFVDLDGHSYDRWSVVPVPGHLDEVLLDTDSGTVLCP
jgi:hypothetical protein